MGGVDYRKVDAKISRYVIVVPFLWVALWVYQEAKVLDNSFFLAQSASFIFMILMPLAYVFHRRTLAKIYRKGYLKSTKEHIAKHRVRLYTLSLFAPATIFSAYFSDIFRFSTEQNIVYGTMLILVTATLQLTFINLFSILMRAPRNQDQLPNILATLGAYPVIAVPVYQSIIYFTLI